MRIIAPGQLYRNRKVVSGQRGVVWRIVSVDGERLQIQCVEGGDSGWRVGEFMKCPAKTFQQETLWKLEHVPTDFAGWLSVLG